MNKLDYFIDAHDGRVLFEQAAVDSDVIITAVTPNRCRLVKMKTIPQHAWQRFIRTASKGERICYSTSTLYG
jgi:hypothetical protein